MEKKLSCSCDNKTGGTALTKTLQDFIQQKGKERVSFPSTGTSNPPPNLASLNQRSKYRKCDRNTVNITVGLIKLDEHGCLKIKRGSRATIAVAPTADWTFVKQLALEKHSNLDQYFCILEDYVLLYPDQKVCQLLPSENITFTVERYKNVLSKPFSKVELFLCLEPDFLKEFNKQDSKTNTRNEQIIDIDDEDVDDDVLLPFPSFCTEGITTTEHKEEWDLRNLDKIFASDGSNNNVSSSLSVAISSRNESSTITTDHQRIGIDRKIPCPICGEPFPINSIASRADLCAGKHENKMLREIHCDKGSGNIDFFFYQGLLSRTLTTHRTAGEGRWPSFVPLYHFHPHTNIQTFSCNFACEMTITYF